MHLCNKENLVNIKVYAHMRLYFHRVFLLYKELDFTIQQDVRAFFHLFPKPKNKNNDKNSNK